MVNGVLLLIEDNKPDESFLSFTYSLHKSPIAYYTCYPIINDYSNIVLFYNALTSSPSLWGDWVVQVFWNLTFNWVDLIYEAVTLDKSFGRRDWTMIGTYLAKILNDIMFKAPTNYSWNYKNSDVLNEEWGQPPSLLQGINQLYVYWGGQSFLTDNEKQN